jgi:Icc protein
LEQVLGEVRSRGEQIDLLVVTGDTANEDELATYVAFRDELAEWLPRLRIVPGNHDERELILRAFPGACEHTGDRVTFHVRRAGWQLIGLDSQRAGDAAGELGAEQLAWLQRLLEAEPDLDTLIFLHHPPIEVGSAWLDEIGLRDADALERLLESHRQVRLVVSGHVHQELEGTVAVARVHTTPAVGPQFRPGTTDFEMEPGPPGYRVIELYPDGRFATRVVRASDA